MRRLIATLAARAGVYQSTIARAVHFLSRAKLLRAARRGLRRGEFHVVYQPIFDVSTSACVGVEALLRWRNETFGGDGPDYFIVHLERTSLIGPLTQFVLRQASTDIRQTPGVDHWHISVNICARHPTSECFVDDIRQAAGTMLNRSHSADDQALREDCARLGEPWVHLRLCLSCGHAGYCDSSPNRHASKHFHATGHPLVRSIEPGETWIWCYRDEIVVGELES